jgi:hypothetical protein
LGYQYVDKERLFQDLEKIGDRWGRVAHEMDEVCPTVWERFDWQYRGYVAQVEALILEYASHDRVVIIGRGSPFLLQKVPFCLRVRLVSPLKVRIERVMVHESLSLGAAERLIAQVDGDRACFIKANYGINWEEEKFYDMTLNTSSLDYDKVVDILVEALAEKDRLATPEAREALADMALAYRLKAKVATDPRVLVPTLEVSSREGTIVVSGITHTPKEQQILQKIAEEVCGDKPVRWDLHHRV